MIFTFGRLFITILTSLSAVADEDALSGLCRTFLSWLAVVVGDGDMELLPWISRSLSDLFIFIFIGIDWSFADERFLQNILVLVGSGGWGRGCGVTTLDHRGGWGWGSGCRDTTLDRWINLI
jgi:hypothetical protein